MDKVTRPSSPGGGSAGDASRLNRDALRRSSLRFGRNTPGIPPSRALSAGRLAGPRRSRHFIHRLLTACGETQAAFERRCIPAEPRRFAALCVALRSKYTRYSSLARLVSRAPPRSRRSPGFHHRLLTGRDHRGTGQYALSPRCAGRRRCEAPTGRTGRRSLTGGAVRIVDVPVGHAFSQQPGRVGFATSC